MDGCAVCRSRQPRVAARAFPSPARVPCLLLAVPRGAGFHRGSAPPLCTAHSLLLQAVHKQPSGEALLDVRTEEGQELEGLPASECCLQVRRRAALLASRLGSNAQHSCIQLCSVHCLLRCWRRMRPCKMNR